MPHESFYPQDWLQLAEKDLERVHLLISIDDPTLAGFCLQQAIEKFLKAFLLSNGWKLRRIHDLEDLLEDAKEYSQSMINFLPACQRISAFYFLVRYPSYDAGINKKDVCEALNSVLGLVDLIRLHFS